MVGGGVRLVGSLASLVTFTFNIAFACQNSSSYCTQRNLVPWCWRATSNGPKRQPLLEKSTAGCQEVEPTGLSSCSMVNVLTLRLPNAELPPSNDRSASDCYELEFWEDLQVSGV